MKGEGNVTEKYVDILDLPHPVFKKHPPMDRGARAAQFAPFSPLTGYGEAAEETARLTLAAPGEDEEGERLLNVRMQWLLAHLKEQPEAEITYFQQDARKAGGKYLQCRGHVKSVRPAKGVLLLREGVAVPLQAIRRLEGPLFPEDADE